MRRSLLSIMRGSDGRSLSLALAALLFLNVLFTGLHAGFAAGPSAGATVLCSVTAPSDSPGLPAERDHDHDCCLAASTPSPLPAAPAFGAPQWAAAIDMVQPPASAGALPSRAVLAREGPRGPPVLA